MSSTHEFWQPTRSAGMGVDDEDGFHACDFATTGDGGFVVTYATTVAAAQGENQRTVTAQRFDVSLRPSRALEPPTPNESTRG